MGAAVQDGGKRLFWMLTGSDRVACGGWLRRRGGWQILTWRAWVFPLRLARLLFRGEQLLAHRDELLVAAAGSDARKLLGLLVFGMRGDGLLEVSEHSVEFR